MNDISSNESVIFQNPEQKPLEDLKLSIHSSGVTQLIPALDKRWVVEKYFLNYEPLQLFDSEGRNIIGAKERWLELSTFILEDLTWLLHLPFYKFWNNIIYNASIMDSITTFLQEAPTFYTLENFPCDDDLKELFDKIRKNVLIVFARLVTNKESPTEYITLQEHGRIIYNEYIITVPILMDLCQQYGRDNRKIVEKIVNSVFTLQPAYAVDLGKAADFIMQALRNIEKRFEDCPIDQDGKPIPLSERGGANIEITLPSLEDMILYLLDTMSTINIFINIYAPAVDKFKGESFLIKIISMYGNTIPEMYKRLDQLAFKDETIETYVELKRQLDITRMEILNIYRKIIYKNIEDIFSNSDSMSPSQKGEVVEDFISNLMHTLSEKDFIIDYHNLYPVTNDIQKILEIYPDLDTVKCEFLLNSIFTVLDEPMLSTSSSIMKVPEPVAGPSNTQNSRTQNSKPLDVKDNSNVAGPSNTNSTSEFDVMPLIFEVKDILCELGEGFIERCLKYYNYNKENVINAVLEDSLPTELRNLDHTLPYIPPDPEEASAAVDSVLGMQRLNVYDNDEFDIMTKDVVDVTRIHKGKRKDKYKDLNALLNDKSHISETKDIYNKYSIINDYDDEYDDTYDDQDIGSSAQDDVVEVDARPFTIPRVLRKQEVNDYEEVQEENTDYESHSQANKDHFVQDPALLRAKAEERRLSKHGGTRVFNSHNKSVVGNPKGQGQTKEVLDSRNQKNKNKAVRANHNRRAGAQWKRNQMVPS